MEKPQTNGAAAQGAAVARTAPQPPARRQETQPQEEKVVEVKVKEPPTLSVEETIKRIEQINDNIQRRRVLKEHLERVEQLRFGEYDDKSTLVLVNSKGEQPHPLFRSLPEDSRLMQD